MQDGRQSCHPLVILLSGFCGRQKLDRNKSKLADNNLDLFEIHRRLSAKQPEIDMDRQGLVRNQPWQRRSERPVRDLPLTPDKLL